MEHRPPRAGRRRIAAALVAIAALAACGSDGDEPASSPDTVTPGASLPPATASDGSVSDGSATDGSATGADAADPDTVTEPLRIVSLSPTHTEMLFAIGAGDQVVAVDDQSNYPVEALELPNDLSGFEPNVEAIAAYEPDLVVIGGDFTGLGDQLAALGIESWDGPAAMTLDDTYTQIEQLGALTGRVGEAAELVGRMQAEIDEIIAAAPALPEPLTVYHELDPTLFSLDSTTFVGELYTMLGLRNVADRIESDSGGYPQLNAEFLVSADPDVIVLADTKCCGQSAATVAARPGWDAIAAVQNGAIVELDDDIASRWGPRVVDLLRTISESVSSVAVGN
jgi:iron complex transport system substrate-binding protein